MKIKAKFKGTNSLGFEHGLDYHLLFYISQPKTISLEGKITIEEPFGLLGRKCEYDSLFLFLQNWEILK